MATLPAAAAVISSTQTTAQQKADFSSMLTFLAERINLGTTSGTGAAYVLTTTPALVAHADRQRYAVRFHLANTIVAPTITRDGLAAKTLKVYDSAGAKAALLVGQISVNMLCDIEYDGVDYVWLNSPARFAGSGPAFSAVAQTNQVLTTAVLTKVTFAVEDFDTNNNFATSRFTPTVPGYYNVNGNVSLSVAGVLDAAYLTLTKNGANYARGFQLNPNSIAIPNVNLSVHSLVFMNGTTDYLELYAYAQGSSTLTLVGATGERLNGFSASLARSA